MRVLRELSEEIGAALAGKDVEGRWERRSAVGILELLLLLRRVCLAALAAASLPALLWLRERAPVGVKRVVRLDLCVVLLLEHRRFFLVGLLLLVGQRAPRLAQLLAHLRESWAALLIELGCARNNLCFDAFAVASREQEERGLWLLQRQLGWRALRRRVRVEDHLFV